MSVDVIIPAYNPGRFFSGMLASVLKQTYRGPYTITIVDDGSSEQLLPQIERFQSDKIVYHRLPQSCGAAAARNEGIRRTSGEYIVYHDADDLMCKDRLEHSVAELEKDPDCMLVHGNVRWIIEGIPEECPRFKGEREIELLTLLIDLPICSATATFRRSALAATGLFNEAYEVAEDYDLWARFAQHFPKQIKYIPVEMIYHNRHSTPSALSARLLWTERHAEILQEMRRNYHIF